MNQFALLLVGLSTFMHAGWNLLTRRRKSQAAVFMWRMTHVTVLAGFVPAVASEAMARSLSPGVWAIVAASGVLCGFYTFFLVMGYESGDFTVVYPVARSIPVILVGLADVARGRLPTALGWAGMALVVMGCLMAPLTSFRDLSLRNYLHRSSVYILLTALFCTGYSVLDKYGQEMVQLSGSGGPATAMRYCYFFFVGNYVVFTILWRLFRRKKGDDEASAGWALPAVGAGLGFGAYGLVVWAYQLTERASYVVAFRQFSIVIGVVAAFALFREKGLLPRLTAATLITAGLVVIGIWGAG